MTASEQIEKLNNGEYAVTYDLIQARPDRKPIIGEFRYLLPLAASPVEPLASMVQLDPVRIVWAGDKWWLDR